MKGILFTAITFLIFLGIMVFVSVLAQTNTERSTMLNEILAGNRIYYIWSDVQYNMADVLGLSFAGTGDVFEINDTFGGSGSINQSGSLTNYDNFIAQYLEDPSIDIHFENEAGAINLNQMSNKLNIQPMNIEYNRNDTGFNITISADNFPYIIYMDLLFNFTPDIKTASIGWDGKKTCNVGTVHCLHTNITYADYTGYVFNVGETEYDADEVSYNEIEIGTKQYFRLWLGSLPNLVNAYKYGDINFTSNIRFKLSTSQFYINQGVKLSVSSVFGKKVNWL